MANQITLWRPDTCACELKFSWDDTVTPRIETIHSFTQKCAIHAAETDVNGYTKIKSENTVKNGTLGHVLKNYAALVEVKPDGSIGLKNGYTYEWSFDAQRRVLADFKGVNRPTAQLIQDSLNLEFGAGKVIVTLP